MYMTKEFEKLDSNGGGHRPNYEYVWSYGREDNQVEDLKNVNKLEAVTFPTQNYCN